MSDQKPMPEAAEEDGKSCVAGAVGDCMALLCCPCAAVSYIVLACFKLPRAMVRCCMGRGRRREVEREEAGGTEMFEAVASGGAAGEGAVELADVGFGHEFWEVFFR
ncbi:hypothetical protein AAHA92_29679 [Salvia divinorum]|uniref:Uncharacterized protein n=1 Tax=Salvia divinorum TaxID=28513 RepID=A0ABD1G054_SALDI